MGVGARRRSVDRECGLHPSNRLAMVLMIVVLFVVNDVLSGRLACTMLDSIPRGPWTCAA